MSPSNPGLAELTRQLEVVVRRLDTLVDRLDKTYVRQDVYDADQRTAGGTHAAISTDLAETNRRLDARDTADADRLREAANTRRMVYIAIFSAILSPIIVTLLLGAVK